MIVKTKHARIGQGRWLPLKVCVCRNRQMPARRYKHRWLLALTGSATERWRILINNALLNTSSNSRSAETRARSTIRADMRLKRCPAVKEVNLVTDDQHSLWLQRTISCERLSHEKMKTKQERREINPSPDNQYITKRVVHWQPTIAYTVHICGL